MVIFFPCTFRFNFRFVTSGPNERAKLGKKRALE